MQIDLRQLQALAMVLEQRSFERAARRLFITQSAVSQRVRQLEERLGQPLIIRANPLRPTVAGQRVLKYYHQVSQLEGELLDQLSGNGHTGSQWRRVAIGINADSLATWFFDAVEPLLAQHRLLLELKVDDQDQTHKLLRDGEVIGCISASSEAIQGCCCTPLGNMIYRCLASPAFKTRYFSSADSPSKADFCAAPAVEFNVNDNLQQRFLARYFDLAPGEYPCHQVPSSESFVELIVRGHAWGMTPDRQSQILRKSSQLIELTPANRLTVPLYWHTWNLHTALHRQLSHCFNQLTLN